MGSGCPRRGGKLRRKFPSHIARRRCRRSRPKSGAVASAVRSKTAISFPSYRAGTRRSVRISNGPKSRAAGYCLRTRQQPGPPRSNSSSARLGDVKPTTQGSVLVRAPAAAPGLFAQPGPRPCSACLTVSTITSGEPTLKPRRRFSSGPFPRRSDQRPRSGAFGFVASAHHPAIRHGLRHAGIGRIG